MMWPHLWKTWFFAKFNHQPPRIRNSSSPSVIYVTKNPDGDISGMKRVTGDQLLSKQTDFRGLFRLSTNRWILVFLNVWVSVFLGGISGYIFGMKRATGYPLVSKQPDFQGVFRFSTTKKDVWISGNGKSYRRSDRVKTTGFLDFSKASDSIFDHLTLISP